ncbi:hypothetical protein F3Y22_tig00116971pilonHSYRG00486 [Hibiscus syriacus]|uniref:Increased DNA methylation 1 C-terminal domain-containing protein n=1 Tax=Hibiscus syriacus TaxID=106335 RepID=A0A6A2WH75_HIBSY|nr:hypothetical protein F3Y22_tig00116971pilonHSYRG00486 [Hibiscus syriacus]
MTRVVKAPEIEIGGCVICRDHDFSGSTFDDQTVILCDQCEEFHVGCLRDSGLCDLKEIPKNKWFCCDDCNRIHGALQSTVSSGVEWRILSGKSRYPEHLPLLSSAAAIFRECFDPIVAKSGRDLIPVMVYGRNISGQEFGGMYCVVLMVRSVVVSAGLLRIFGWEVAELPIVATSRKYQGKVNRVPYFLPDLRLTKDMPDSGVGYIQGRVSTLELPFRTRGLLERRESCGVLERLEIRDATLLVRGRARVWKHQKRTVGPGSLGPFLFRFEIGLRAFGKWPLNHLLVQVEPENWISFVVKLKSKYCSESNILRYEVEIGSGNGKLYIDNQWSLRREVNLCCLESNILRCEVEIGSEIGKLFVDNQPSLRCELKLALKLGNCLLKTNGPFIVKLNLRCLESNILRCEVEIGSEIEKLFVDNQRSLRREVELALSRFELDILRREVEIYLRSSCVASRETVSRETKFVSKRNCLKGDKT